MDTQKAFLVIIIILIVVIVFNLGIYSFAKKRGSQINLLTRVYHRARNPWKEDDEKLQELSEYVAKYKDNKDLKKDEGD